jgi:hypothetical protein
VVQRSKINCACGEILVRKQVSNNDRIRSWGRYTGKFCGGHEKVRFSFLAGISSNFPHSGVGQWFGQAAVQGTRYAIEGLQIQSRGGRRTSLFYRLVQKRHQSRFGPQPEISQQQEKTMAVCEKCGNDYDKTFVINIDGSNHTFDSFECAVNTLAPVCRHCGNRIIGHGMESRGDMYCSAHCAHTEGVAELVDRL